MRRLESVVDPVTGVKVSFQEPGYSTLGRAPIAPIELDHARTHSVPESQFACLLHNPPHKHCGAAMGAVKGLTKDGLFIGQSGPDFFQFLTELASHGRCGPAR